MERIENQLLRITSVADSDCSLVLSGVLSVQVARSSHTLLSPHLYLEINKLSVLIKNVQQTNFQNCIRKCPNTEYNHKLLVRIQPQTTY